MQLEHVGIAVRADRFQATLEFYEDVLLWRRVRQNPGDFIFLADGNGGRIEFFPRESEPIDAPHHLAFEASLESIDVLVDRLQRAGVESQPPRVTPAGDTVVYFHDPAGNYCQIIARPEPLPS